MHKLVQCFILHLYIAVSFTRQFEAMGKKCGSRGDRQLRRIFGRKREEVSGGWRIFVTKSFVMFALHELL
jgi:hypothetical protein